MKLAFLDANTLGDDLDLSIFDEFGDVKIYGFSSKEEVAERIKDLDIIIANKTVLNESNLKDAKDVKLICLTSTGTNIVDKVYTNQRGIKVANVKGYSTESVAQHTFSLLFYLYEKLAYYDRYVKDRKYVNDKMFTHFDRRFHEINGKTFGIIGLGEIGQRVAEIGKLFGCQIIYYSTSGKNTNPNYEQCSLNELLERADIISIHAPLNENTENLITYNELSKMKSTAILMNLGRGKIVNESDLARALNEDIIGGAALDVLEYEPINGDNPLLDIQDSTKLIITPHIAWASTEARTRMVYEVKLNIEAFLEGKERNIVKE
jgi:glycerate dehydrogenase